jgi:hypothetical protein
MHSALNLENRIHHTRTFAGCCGLAGIFRFTLRFVGTNPVKVGDAFFAPNGTVMLDAVLAAGSVRQKIMCCMCAATFTLTSRWLRHIRYCCRSGYRGTTLVVIWNAESSCHQQMPVRNELSNTSDTESSSRITLRHLEVVVTMGL